VVQARLSCRRSERGQALVEYAMIVAVVGACLVAILGLVAKATSRAYDRTASAVSLGASSGYPVGGGVILTSAPSTGRRAGRGSPESPPDSVGGGAEDSLNTATTASR
jgi:Flp pilus assembly pilin Flp